MRLPIAVVNRTTRKATGVAIGIVLSVTGIISIAPPLRAASAECSGPVPAGRDPMQPLLYAKRSQFWFVRGSRTSGPADTCFVFGNPGDIGVVGDWNGDGTKTPGVFRPSTGTWYLSNSLFATAVDSVHRYGSPGDVPIIGDWDGDGAVTLGVFRAGRWYLTNHNDSGIAEGVFAFGQSGDQPVDVFSDHSRLVFTLYRSSIATMISGVSDTPDQSVHNVGSTRFGNPGDRFVTLGSSCSSNQQFAGAAVFRPSTATWWLSDGQSGSCPVQFGSATDQMLWSPPTKLTL